MTPMSLGYLQELCLCSWQKKSKGRQQKDFA